MPQSLAVGETIDRADQAERQRQQPDGESDSETRADQFAAASHLQCERDRGESADQTGHQQRRVDFSKQHATPQTDKNCGEETMMATEQHA